MVTPELLAFIRGEQTKGVSKETIINLLRTQDWTDADIAEAFNAMSPSQVPITNESVTTTQPKSHKKLLLYSLIAIFLLILGIGAYQLKIKNNLTSSVLNISPKDINNEQNKEIPVAQSTILDAEEKIASNAIESPSLGECLVPTYKQQNFEQINYSSENNLNIFVIKFKNGVDIRLKNKDFISLCNADVDQLNQILKVYELTPYHTYVLSEAQMTIAYENAKKNSPGLPDPNLEYTIQIPKNMDKDKIIKAMTAFRDSLFISKVYSDVEVSS